jgi:uncharacterized protein (TIGR00369 family)
MTREEAQAIVDQGPYLRWLGIEVLSFEDKAVEIKAKWREEWVANPAVEQTQGGILAALIDFAADFALVPQLGRMVPTIDMRVDYHRMAKRGDLTVKGRVIKLGRRFSVCEAEIRDAGGELVASGRGTYFTGEKTA